MNEDLIYIPGNFKCPKCKCGLVAKTLYMKSGGIGPNNNAQECPNECGPMWKVTWKERCNEQDETCLNLFTQNEKLKAREQKLLEIIDEMKTILAFYSRKDADQITDVCIWQGEGCAAGWAVVDQGDKANETIAKVEEMMKELNK